ncbi:gamma-aminobutyric acid type B receptor subunit 1-like [Patiria miniata]|uniref:Gamma-aminobutyric acid type B receptor subunit 2 n=1 Tax=Patiria miniata TaxID=46514 RepID=A0A913ZMW3_PATMI|nr:gamma-aminobutyric acid type B receptor subunit 1-like [Patiria miniata]
MRGSRLHRLALRLLLVKIEKMLLLVAVALTVAVTPCLCQSNVTKLYLLGLFPESGPWAGAETALPAAQLAVDDINGNPDVLPGYEIVLIPRDTECNGGKATDIMYRELYNTSTTKTMIIGGGCSLATEPTAQASHFWNLIQISYAASSPKLSDRLLYPRFFRLYQPETTFNLAKLTLIKKFNWTKVATIYESLPLFSLTFAEFHHEAKKAGIEVIAQETFGDDPTTQMEHLKESGTRIIVGGFYSDAARKVFCAAYHLKMFGAKYVWILPGWLALNTWLVPDDTIDCSLDQLKEVAGYQFGVNALSLLPDTHQTLSGMTTSALLARFNASVGTDDPESLVGFAEIPFSYDTIWTAALALHEAEQQLEQLDPPKTLADFTYDDNTTVQILFDVISNMTFQGVSWERYSYVELPFVYSSVIKMSSPNINNVMLIGGMLAYVSIIFLGVDTNIASTDTFVSMCRVKTWFLPIGFSLAFGAMFSKTWRVHKIFTNKTAMKRVVKDKWLFGCVAVLILVDVVILIVWEIFDPLEAVERIGATKIDDGNDDIVYTPIRMMCESRNQTYWIGAFYVIDGLLLIFGAFLAWETRKVSMPALNDSKYIGVCVYNVLILSFVGAPVSFILEERNAHYALVATLIWLATTLTLCVVFVPKIRMRNEVQPAQSALVTQLTQCHPSGHSPATEEVQRLRQELNKMKGHLDNLGIKYPM